MQIDTLREDFCSHATYFRGCSTDTVRRYRSTLRNLERVAGIHVIAECTRDRIEAYLYAGRADRRWSARSLITFHNSLTAFFRWCVATGYLTTNPMEGIELPKVPKSLPERLSRQQAQRLLDYVRNYPYPHPFQRQRNFAIFSVFLFAGLRKSEVLKLQMVDVDLINLTHSVRRGKGSKDRVVPIGVSLAAALHAYLAERSRLGKTCPEVFTAVHRDRPFTAEGLKRIVSEIGRSSGLRFHLHALRHTFATLMLEGGCDIFSLSRMMGHSDIKTTTIYLAASAQHLHGQMAKHPLNASVQWGRQWRDESHQRTQLAPGITEAHWS